MKFGRLTRWKRDLQIAASWLNTPLLYFTFAEIAYNNNGTIRSVFPSHIVYLVVAGVAFIPFLKLVGLIVIRLGVYAQEVGTNLDINPYGKFSYAATKAMMNKLGISDAEFAESLEQYYREVKSLILENRE